MPNLLNQIPLIFQLDLLNLLSPPPSFIDLLEHLVLFHLEHCNPIFELDGILLHPLPVDLRKQKGIL